MDKSAFGMGDAKPTTPAPIPLPLFPIADPRLAEFVAKWEMLSDDQRKEVLRVGGPWKMPAQPAVDTPPKFVPLDLRPEGEHGALWDPEFCRVMRAWRSLPADVREDIVRLAETPTPATPATVLGPITAIDVLRSIEWSARRNGCSACPVCNAYMYGHAADCDLAAVLREHTNANLAPPAPRG